MFEIAGSIPGRPPNRAPKSLIENLLGPASIAIIAIALLLAFSESLRQVVSKSYKIGSGLFKDFILHPVRSFLHWESFKSKMPSLVVPDESTMRKRFNDYLGYERHQTQFDEDFWERRQKNQSSLAEAGRKRRKRAKFQDAWQSLSEKTDRHHQEG